MKLIDITLKNYRNFEEYKLELGQKATVLIGRNGMGKTNLLNGMVQSLSFIFSKQRNTEQYEFIRSTDQGVKAFLDTDARYCNRDYQYPISLISNAVIGTDDSPVSLGWTFEQESKKSGLKDSMFREAYRSFWDYYNTVDQKPVLAFFSAGFPHKDTNIGSGMKEKLKSGNPLPAGDGYYQWDKEQSCVNIWKRYFIQQWLNNRLSFDPEKAAYVDAINQKLRQFSTPMDPSNALDYSAVRELSVDYRDGEATLLITMEDGSTKPFDTLPAGFERIYSMVLDLASRSYLLNGNTDPDGIVLIDEIDLHLHPSLEAEILPRLQNAFRKVQFIVTTHSPMVLSNFDQSAGGQDDYKLINLLRDDDGFYNVNVGNLYGLDYNSSLTNFMGTRQHQAFTDSLADAYRYWKYKDGSKADRIAELLLKKYDRSSDIIRSLGL